MQKPDIQGDVALMPAELPAGARKIELTPLAYGETSGHAHVLEPIAKGKAEPELFEMPDGTRFVVAGSDGAQLRHVRLKTGEQADHHPIILVPGQSYRVILQNEFNPEAGAFERVID